MEVEVASFGTAESYLSASSVIRTRQAHHEACTACSLCKLMKKVYHDYCSKEPGISDETFEDWYEQRRKESRQIQFWNLVLDMELTIFTLIPSFREGDFNLY